MSTKKKPAETTESVAEVKQTAITEETPAPAAEVSNEVENKAPVVPAPDAEVTEKTEEPIIKSGFRKIKASNFRGSYQDAKFDDEGCCEITETTLASLKADYPGIEIEEVD